MMRKTVAALAATTMIAGAALATAPAASAASTRTTVNAWYADFLGRDADQGSAYWIDRIEAGALPSDQVWAITHSREFDTDEITAYYQYYLGYDLDPGASYWVEGTVAQRFPLEWVEQNILASDEHAARNSRRDPAASRTLLVYRWYYAILGRSSTGESSYWTDRIVAVGRLAALRELWYTPEAVQHRITDTYQALLGRSPSAGELAYWYPKEVESDINVAVLIASTPEYADLAD